MPVYDCGAPDCSECQRAFGPDRTSAIRDYQAKLSGKCPRCGEPEHPDQCTVPAQAAAPRFYIDHGVIHDRSTGQHVRTCDCGPSPPFDTGIEDALSLLNNLSQ